MRGLDNGKVCEMVKCGGDIWWAGELMIEQLTCRAIQAFERSFSGCQALFAFDNGKCHQQYSINAHCTGTMNLTPGWKNTVPQCDRWWVQLGGSQERQIQAMVLSHGRLKSVCIVLHERSPWSSASMFLAQC